MGIKVVQMASAPPPPTPTPRCEQPKGWRQKGPQASSEKPFLLSDGKVTLEANLDKSIYTHGDPIHVSINVMNTSKKVVRRIKVKPKNKTYKKLFVNNNNIIRANVFRNFFQPICQIGSIQIIQI